MAERQVTTVEEEGKSDLDDRVREANDLTEQLQGLKQAKQERIARTDERRSESSNNAVFTGHVHRYSDRGTHAAVYVRYLDEGEEKEEMFSMKKPGDSSEYSVENDLVRFIEYVGDGQSGEVESTLERDVPLKKEDGEVELDIPEPGGMSEFVHASKRELEARNLIGSQSTVSSIARNTGKIAVAGMSGIVGATTLSTLLVSSAYQNSEFVIDILLTWMIFAFPAIGFIISYHIITGGDGENVRPRDIQATAGFLTAISLFFSGLILTGTVPVADTTENLNQLTPWISILAAGSGSVLLGSALWYAYRPAASTVKWTRSKVKSARRRLQLRRGVEYVRE